MTEWNYIVIILSFLLLVFSLWKEVSRKNKGKLLLRLFATLMSVVSLACIAFPLHYNKTKSDNSTHEAILLTEGFNNDSLTKFLSANNDSVPLIFLDKNIENSDKYNVNYLADIHLLAREYKDINTFHLFGFGLSKEDLNALPKSKIVFHSSALPSGIAAIHWNQKSKTGEPLVIQGKYNNTASSKAKIVLTSFNATLDSAYISANQNEGFSLTTIPKAEGRTIYTLSVIKNRDTTEQETIPLQVESGDPVKVFFLASSPDFDNKFLQNSLAKSGYEVAVRTRISKSKYASNYLNTSAVSLDHITSSLLDKFTVIIADATELNMIPKSELATIQLQVAQKNMGLLVRADSASPSSFYATNFPVNAVAGDTQQQLKTFLLDTSDQLPLLVTDYPLSIKNVINTQPIVWDKQNKIYASSTIYGLGKIVFTTIPNTYTWGLSGNKEAYDKFWAALLNKATVKPQTNESWSISPALPLVNDPVQLLLQTNNAGIPQGQVNNTPVYLKENPDLTYEWTGTYYPVKEGWQTGIGLNGKPLFWYAHGKNDWQNVYASQKIIATQQYISSNLYSTEKRASADLTEPTEVPKIYLFLLFLLCCGFLWAESKGLFSTNT